MIAKEVKICGCDWNILQVSCSEQEVKGNCRHGGHDSSVNWCCWLTKSDICFAVSWSCKRSESAIILHSWDALASLLGGGTLWGLMCHEWMNRKAGSQARLKKSWSLNRLKKVDYLKDRDAFECRGGRKCDKLTISPCLIVVSQCFLEWESNAYFIVFWTCSVLP